MHAIERCGSSSGATAQRLCASSAAFLRADTAEYRPIAFAIEPKAVTLVPYPNPYELCTRRECVRISRNPFLADVLGAALRTDSA